MIDFFNYIGATWIYSSARFPPAVWSNYKLSERTNNASEGYHSGFARKFLAKHPNIYFFLFRLKIEHQKCSNELAYYSSGKSKGKPKKEFALFNAKMSDLYEILDNSNKPNYLQFVFDITAVRFYKKASTS